MGFSRNTTAPNVSNAFTPKRSLACGLRLSWALSASLVVLSLLLLLVCAPAMSGTSTDATAPVGARSCCQLASVLAGVPQRDRFVNGTATLKSDDNHVGTSYSFNYDLGRGTMLTSRIMGYYNAQCCGFAIEYQTYSFGQTGVLSGLGNDRRFNFTFTLAGLGTFSNFFGALGGGGTPQQ